MMSIINHGFLKFSISKKIVLIVTISGKRPLYILFEYLTIFTLTHQLFNFIIFRSLLERSCLRKEFTFSTGSS